MSNEVQSLDEHVAVATVCREEEVVNVISKSREFDFRGRGTSNTEGVSQSAQLPIFTYANCERAQLADPRYGSAVEQTS